MGRGEARGHRGHACLRGEFRFHAVETGSQDLPGLIEDAGVDTIAGQPVGSRPVVVHGNRPFLAEVPDAHGDTDVRGS